MASVLFISWTQNARIMLALRTEVHNLQLPRNLARVASKPEYRLFCMLY
jgi:hypothetical protein